MFPKYQQTIKSIFRNKKFININYTIYVRCDFYSSQLFRNKKKINFIFLK